MSKVIRIDDDVFAKLQKIATKKNIPFSNPNNILRIALKLKPLTGSTHTPAS